ncbi:MAG: hypothetical protein KAI29_09935, partial [Cyclobacteriaceae bacterium]|nr:hypothetical protein [Cyclobacteriaceae bacterium]
WQLFTEVEKEGGFINSFTSGKIQSRVKETREKRLALAAQRRKIFVGTNQYPNNKEQLDPEKSNVISEEGTIEVLKQENGAIEFETLRLTTDRFAKKTGKRPKAYLALIGNNPTMRTARAQFCGGFIGCGGFDIIDGIVTQSNEEAINKALDQKAEITVICGADDDYTTSGIEFAKKFREADKDGILVLAGYPTDSLEDLKEAGVDEFIHIRADLIKTLKNFQQKLNIK